MSIPRVVLDERPNYPEVWEDILHRWAPGWKPSLVALYRIGSHSHGTHVPPSDPQGIDDIDYMAIVIPPPERVFGLEQFDHHVIKEGDLDVTIYSWQKYVGLLLKANPNVIGTLWLEPEDAWSNNIYPLWTLRMERRIFSSRQLCKSFLGYARAQMYKMTHHAHQGYMGAKRKLLVEKYGYDVKNAAHLIRLLRMCAEFLVSGELRVRRNDADELIAIKRGEWRFAQVQEEADRLFKTCDKLEIESVNFLPEQPDRAQAEYILMQACWNAWGRNYRV